MSTESGTLYIVATPIGNLDDIPPRALATLRDADLIAAEDTRHSGGLLRHFAINTPMISLHEHNEAERSRILVERLLDGETVALISDAGTPLISDPGYVLVRAAQEAGITVVPVPGPSALITALCASGLPTDRFSFEGFPPAKGAARRKWLAALADEGRTLVFYESPHRIRESLDDMAAIFGAQREAVLARELTKRFETIRRAPLVELARQVAAEPDQGRGEMVVMVSGAPAVAATTAGEGRRIALILAEELPKAQAAALAARITGEKKRDIYAALTGK